MLNDLQKDFGQIRQAIADGDSEIAIKLLSLRCVAGDTLHDSLILLETRLSNLQQSVIEGVVSREDENIERNGISKGLLSLVKTLETRAEHPLEAPIILAASPVAQTAPTAEASAHPATTKGKSNTRKWAVAAGVLFTLAILWGIITWASEHPSAPTTRDAIIRIAVNASNIPIGPLGNAYIESGTYTSESKTVPPDGVLMFKETPAQLARDSIKLRLPDLKYKHEIVRMTGGAKNEFAFQVRLKTITFSGKVLRPDLRPAPNVELVIEHGLAHTTTDALGNFAFVLPDWGASKVHVLMRRAGKVLVERDLGYAPAVFRELKTPE